MRARATPYTQRGIKRVPCRRCGAPSSQQWQICADFSSYRAVCLDCDIEMNRLVLEFMRFPDVGRTIEEYRQRLAQHKFQHRSK